MYIFAVVVALGSTSLPAPSARTPEVTREASTDPGTAAVATPSTRPDPFSAPFPPMDGTASGAASSKRGDAYRALGYLAAAARSYREALERDPGSIELYESMRQVLVQSGRTERLPDVLARLATLYMQRAKAGDRASRVRAEQRLDQLILLEPGHAARASLEQALGRIQNVRLSNTSWLDRLRSLVGLLVMLGLAIALSTHRRSIRWRIVLWGVGLQLTFALIILKTPPGRWTFEQARAAIENVLSYTDAGARFLFGKLYDGMSPVGVTGPVMFTDGTSGDLIPLGSVFAFQVLPTIIFFGALMGVFYHAGIVQKVVRAVAWLMVRTMGTSGSESLSAAGNIFVGQTEAPLLVKPYIHEMTRSELMAVMTGGFATVAGGVLAAYVRFGVDAGHLLAASVMSAPAALVIAKILVPETQTSQTAGGHVHDPPKETRNVIDAAASGATDGLRLALNVGAMLIAFIALVALVNGVLNYVADVSLREIFGYVLYPLSWCLGADSQDLLDFGTLLGTKISINEFVAFVDLANLRNSLSERSFVIATYALCGFANFSSIGIQIGGISSIAPDRRSELAAIGLRAMVGGALASWMTACVAGMLL